MVDTPFIYNNIANMRQNSHWIPISLWHLIQLFLFNLQTLVYVFPYAEQARLAIKYWWLKSLRQAY